jgi:sugar-specific transcriptional regulator TrmB
MDETILEDLGLTKAEIRVYLSLLKLGASTSGPIIQKSGVQSSVVHLALKSLLDKGIVSFIKIGKDRQYQATDPKNLLDYIENKKKKFLDILPELEEKQKEAKNIYLTEMFLGKKAMFSLLLNMIADAKPNEEYLSFSLIEPHDDEELVDFYQTYNLRRREKKLEVKVLVNEKVKPIYEKNYSKELLKKAHVRYTSFHFPQGIIIFRQTVTFVHWGENSFAVKIENKEMARQFKEFFLEFYNKEKNAY